MAGVKGKSGGARVNAGGARAGAGRKPKEKPEEEAPTLVVGDDSLQLLKDIAFGRVQVNAGQIRAAIAAVQYEHAKMGEGGKKDAKGAAAEKAAQGRYGARPGPRAQTH